MHWSKTNPEKWKKHCESMNGNKMGAGHKITDCHRSKLIEANKSRVWSAESKGKVSKSVKEYFKTHQNPMQGKTHTVAAKRKIVESNLKNANRGSNHYAFKGSSAKCPRGVAWYRKRKSFIKKYSDAHGYECELCNGAIGMGSPIDVHHLVLVEEVIDVIQDINKDWNLMFLCHKCHIRVHNKLRGMNSKVDNWEYYSARSKKAKRKMDKLIEVQNESKA